MITLEEISRIACLNHACSNQLKPFMNFLKNGDERSCWEIVNGNIDWFKVKGIYGLLEASSDLELLKMSDGIGKKYDALGVYRKLLFNGNFDDYHEIQYYSGSDNGKIERTVNVKCDKYVGSYHLFDYNGRLKFEAYYNENGNVDGKATTWYLVNGGYIETYDNGLLVKKEYF